MAEYRYPSRDRAVMEVADMGVNPLNALTSSSGNKANANAVATITPTATTTAYLTGIEVTGAGATAASVVSLTIAGVLGGTMTHTIVVPAGVTTSIVPLTVQYFPGVPASGVNTPIVVTLPALGAGNTNATVVAHGFQA